MQMECWPIFVAINNRDLEMIMYLWQDIGNERVDNPDLSESGITDSLTGSK